MIARLDIALRASVEQSVLTIILNHGGEVNQRIIHQELFNKYSTTQISTAIANLRQMEILEK